MEYDIGKFETLKFAGRRDSYYEGLNEILSLGYSQEDLLHHFPSFVGHMTISRFIALYELYKMTLGVAGHVAEAGVFKGAGTLWFAKLAQIFEPESMTLIHGFDWFEGNRPTAEEPNVHEESYKEDYDRVMKLVRAQKLDHVVTCTNWICGPNWRNSSTSINTCSLNWSFWMPGCTRLSRAASHSSGRD